MIQAKELMIGDWVCYCKANGYVTRVDDIRRYGDETLGYVYAIGCRRDRRDPLCEKAPVDSFNVEILHPVPLTTEILEQNGFKYREWSYDYDRYDQWNLDDIDENGKYNGTLVTINRRKDGHWMDVRCGGNGFWDISHVHHLQHIMRLSGVEKGIKLEE